MKDRYAYHIHSENGTEKSFYAENNEEAEDIMYCDKCLPKNIQLDLNRYNEDGTWTHVTTMMKMSSPATKL